MKFLIRADASHDIGSGHIMRCLTLAHELSRRGHEVRFICRALPGHLGETIERAGFGLVLLPVPPQAGRLPEKAARQLHHVVHHRADADIVVIRVQHHVVEFEIEKAGE